MIKLIVYDLDGTLIDSREDIANAVNETLKELNRRELTVKQISSFVGSGVRNLMCQALSAVGAAGGLERSIKIFRRRYGEHLLDQTRLYPSVRPVLEFFRDRKQAVFTNKPQDFSIQILKGLGIDRHFFRVIGGDQGFPKKPAPEPLLELIRQAEVSKEETVLIGDSATDIETGRNAGVTTVAVTYGFGKPREIVAARPQLIVNDLAELTNHSLFSYAPV